MTRIFLDLAAPGVRGLQPYQAGKPIAELEREYGVRDIVKLASNENPLGPGPRALASIAACRDLARYPDANAFELKRALAARHAVPPECITLGNGSNEVLVLIAECFLGPGLEAVYSRYAFAVYPLAVQAAAAVHRVVEALPEDAGQPLGHDLEAMAAAIGPRRGWCSSPTRTIRRAPGWMRPALEGFIGACPPDVLVVVDEAYFEYVSEPGIPMRAAGWTAIRTWWSLALSPRPTAWPACASATRCPRPMSPSC
jgi:histidinol-phosphate aminotransferase